MADRWTGYADGDGKEAEVEALMDRDFEALLGAVSVFEEFCSAYVNGKLKYSDLKQQKSVVYLCAVRLGGGI